MNPTIALTNLIGPRTTAADARPGTAAYQWLAIVIGVYVLFGLAGFFAASGAFMP